MKNKDAFLPNELVILKIANHNDRYLNNQVGRITAPFGMFTYGPDTLGVWLLDKNVSGGRANVEPHEILSWGVEFDRICRTHGVTTKKDRNLLQEAYRRRMMFQPDRALANAWLGLGSLSEYKSRLFQTVDGDKTPRVQHWWKLTHDGVMVLNDIIGQLPFPESNEAKTHLNDILYGRT
jgi:hypothetical protein